MRSLLILGAGGHGKVVAEAAIEEAMWSRLAFLDDSAVQTSEVQGIDVVGTINDMAKWSAKFTHAIVAVGDAELRIDLLRKCVEYGFALATVTHPSAVVSKHAAVGPGSVVLAQAAVIAGVNVGSGCIINTGATVDHDCNLGDGVHVCPGAHIAGSVEVGSCTWIGIGACVRQRIRIGSHVTVGAGAVVVSDVGDFETVVGVPARVVSKTR